MQTINLQDALKWLKNESKEIDENNEINYCYITKQPIEHKIKLKCGHIFEYDAILNHLLVTQNKNRSYHICPYCRTKINLFLPYYETCKIIENKPNNHLFKNNYLTCSYEFKSGKNKNNCCNKHGHKFSHGNFCFQHSKNKDNRKSQEICCQTLKNGNPCKFKVYDKTTKLCKRHFNLKNKELNTI